MKQLKTLCAVAAVSVLAGCTSVDLMAPIDDRSKMSDGSPAQTLEVQPSSESSAQALPVTGDPVQIVPSHLNAERVPVESGRVHVVAAGDTLYNIGVRYHVNPRELAALNGITDPTTISIGRELKLPESAEAVPTAAPQNIAPVAVEVSEGEAIDVQPQTAQAPITTLQPETAGAVEVAKRPATPDERAQQEIVKQKQAREAAARGDLQFRWPAEGEVIATFDQTKKGIDIAGRMGDPIRTVLDGTVQYVGNGTTKGYGQFVIVRHNVRLPGKGAVPLVTVYGNASKVLVRINESVRAGQKIAEMGDSDTDRVKLRFEVRQGAPVDPLMYLQPRK